MTAIATIEHINPAGLISNPAFSQVVTVAGQGAGLAHPAALVEVEATAVIALDPGA